jgi:hypothetical protein
MTDTNKPKVTIDTLLETSFSDIADSPDFITPVPGAYVVQIGGAELKAADSESPYIQVLYKMVNAIEPQEAVDAAYPEGSMFTERYYGGIGASNMKKVFADVIEKTGTANLGELLDKMGGLEVAVTVGQRKDREDPTKVYATVRSVVML